MPVPSTCPCTTWPPSRSPARSGSSTFTLSPAANGPSEERLSVSAITSALKPSARGSSAVRHTPLTATESPWRSSAASGVSTSRRTPSPSGLTRRTSAVLSTRPVNISPFCETRAHEHVLVDLLHRRRQSPPGLVDQLDALAVERASCTRAAREQRREEDTRLVDLVRVHERPGEVRAALEQHRLDLERPEFLQPGSDARGLGV